MTVKVLDHDAAAAAGAAVGMARRGVAVGQFQLATACLEYSDVRRAVDRQAVPRSVGRRPEPGEFAADELAMMLRQQPWHVRCLVNRSRRIRAQLPTVWEGFARGDVDAEQVVMIDRIARRATQQSTLAAMDEGSVGAAQDRSPKQLASWLLRLLVALELEAFAARHRMALADRRVCVVQGPDGVGYVTGEMTAADAAAVDAMLTAAAHALGADDPRTEQQRRADLFTELLLGRLRLVESEEAEGRDFGDSEGSEHLEPVSPEPESEGSGDDWIEVEEVDPETGELLGTRRQPVDDQGYPVAAGVGSGLDPPLEPPIAFRRRPQTHRIAVVVPLSSLLNLTDTPAELVDHSGCVPGATLRDAITEALGRGDTVLFTRLLTDDGGRLLDVTELGRRPSRRLAEAVRIRAGTCVYPTCTVPADRCDLDHREPHPQGPTAGRNLDPGCRRHHRGKTFAWLAAVRDGDTVSWTLPDDSTYRVVDDPLPTGRPARARSA